MRKETFVVYKNRNSLRTACASEHSYPLGILRYILQHPGLLQRGSDVCALYNKDQQVGCSLLAIFTLKTISKTRLFKYTEIFPQKNENFQIKNSDIFHISAQNIDCGYSLEPPRLLKT